MNPFTSSLKAVWDSSKYCRIDKGRLEIVALSLARKNLIVPNWRGPTFPFSDDDNFIDFLGVTNSVNFCFTNPKTRLKFDTEYPDKSKIIYSGSAAMVACIKRALDNGVPILSPEYLADLKRSEAEMIFRHHSNPIPMLDMRIHHLRSTGYALLRNGVVDSFAKIFRDAEFKLFNNGDGIVERLAKRFMSYSDECRFKNFRILFYKRAQLFPMVYYGRALDSFGKLPIIQDPENFGVITDTAVPNALRILGILKYKKELEKMIDEGIRIFAESRMEMEIRAISGKVMNDLLARVNEIRVKLGNEKITMAELDYFIWSTGRKPNHKFKYHLTYTTAY